MVERPQQLLRLLLLHHLQTQRTEFRRVFRPRHDQRLGPDERGNLQETVEQRPAADLQEDLRPAAARRPHARPPARREDDHLHFLPLARSLRLFTLWRLSNFSPFRIP